ncbi:glycosyltransferase family 4 protein [Vibrio coralliilyticus]|uniref:glycosyltransferase n=1 Tax=Vibrio coralliilyticus TaxID=190893 RepID=UPI00148C3804|nr:glycosyltransferase [Vibrio coralliilyticus]NOH54521.1 glycosyltransferase family 4 protein [Vibrio coralliilyticus]
MKIYILFELKKGASGGGNQFLNALRAEFDNLGVYTDNVDEADVILFNSYQYIDSLLDVKTKYPNKVYVHRVDGPICLYNRSDDKRDLITNSANDVIADATIFQSNWSKNRCLEHGLRESDFNITICNAPDPSLFYQKINSDRDPNQKIRLISTSWSSNINKGFDVYKWLDKNLDFNIFEYIFVGNSPVKFDNIKMLEPMNSEQLANTLRMSDIYITASKKDPCSNSLIEAIHCGIYPIALDDGGHSELVNQQGKLFKTKEELLSILDSMSDIEKLTPPPHNLKKMDKAAHEYLEFFSFLLSSKKSGQLVVKKLNTIKKLKVRYTLLRNKINSRFGV